MKFFIDGGGISKPKEIEAVNLTEAIQIAIGFNAHIIYREKSVGPILWISNKANSDDYDM